jgi:hypothetical protein
MSAQDLEKILAEVRQLSPEDRLRLIKSISKTMAALGGAEARGSLIYGKYRNSGAGLMSTEEDFRFAQWRPTEKDLNGP